MQAKASSATTDRGGQRRQSPTLSVVHGSSRSWSYPEQALRNYARNYAEAVGRLTGETERLPEIGDVAVHPVSEDRIDDWLRFLTTMLRRQPRLGFQCYCLEPHLPATPELPNAPGAKRERRWPSGYVPARPSGISPMSATERPAG